MIKLIHGDCLEEMRRIKAGTVDLILCDLPYGTSRCKWDSIIPFVDLWENYKHVINGNAAIVLFGVQPFSSTLVMSNLDWFRYQWVWDKKRPSNPLNAKIMCLKVHEDVIVFSSRGIPAYFPQGTFITDGKPRGGTSASKSQLFGKVSKKYHQTVSGYPKSIIQFGTDNIKNVHPTQKPVALMEYMIKTYTNDGDLVLDNCMGSGTTGVACKNLGRSFIGIEKDKKYFDIARERIGK